MVRGSIASAVLLAAGFTLVAAEPPASPVPATAERHLDEPENGDATGPTMIFFDWNSSKISSESASSLDRLVARRQQHLGDPVQVRAFSDRSGSRASSLAMAKRRGEAVRAYLVGHGVTGAVLVRPVGDMHPLVRTVDGVREAQNRRVEVDFSSR